MLDFLGEHGLDELADQLAVDPMAIGHGKEMCASVLAQVRQHKERVLVDFVRVLWRIACLRGKRKLRHAIIKFLARLSRLHRMLVLRGAHLLRNGGAHIGLPAVIAQLLASQGLLHVHFRVGVAVCVDRVVCRLVCRFLLRGLAVGALVPAMLIRLFVLGGSWLRRWRMGLHHGLVVIALILMVALWIREVLTLPVCVLRVVSVFVVFGCRFHFHGMLQSA